MRERNTKTVRLLLAVGLVVLLSGCIYGNPGYYGYGDYSGYDGYNDQYYGSAPVVDPAAAVLGPAIAGIEHLLIGPIVGSIMGGTLGYGYDQPYYHDRYYNDRYGYDSRYDDNYYRDDYNRYPYNPYYPR
jgi:hypothetical protein